MNFIYNIGSMELYNFGKLFDNGNIFLIRNFLICYNVFVFFGNFGKYCYG